MVDGGKEPRFRSTIIKALLKLIQLIKLLKRRPYISKLFMPPDSTDRLLAAPVKAARCSRRYSHSASYQELCGSIREGQGCFSQPPLELYIKLLSRSTLATQ